MKKIKKIEKLTNLKFINIYQVTYKLENGKEYKYLVASRRDLNSLECKKHKVDAVRVLPYIKKDGKIYVVLIKEFRYAIGKHIYGTPAGLVDDGETTLQAIIRELKEEIGAKVINCKQVQKASYSSAGFSDETIECFEAEVDLAYAQALDSAEDITIKLVELNELPNFVNTHEFGLQSALQLKAFYYEQKYNELSGEKVWKE